MNIKDILEKDNIRDALLENISYKENKIDIELDFSKGGVRGWFIVYTKDGYQIFGENIWQDKDILRIVGYMGRDPEGKSYKILGENRIPVNNIEKIVIRGKQY